MGGTPRLPSDRLPTLDASSSYAPPAESLRNRTIDQQVEHEVLPRLMLAHRAGPLPPSLSIAAARELSAADVAAFVDLVRRGDEDEVGAHLQDVVRGGVPVECVYLDLLAPTARVLGELWAEDRCDFMDVTLGLGRLQRALRELGAAHARAAVESEGAGHILLACTPGEQHTLGMFMVAEFFMRDGWSVSAGPPLTENDLLHTVHDAWYDVIGFSAGSAERLGTLRHQIARVRRTSRNPNLVVLVGGSVFGEDPALVGRIGADGWAEDARQAPSVARAMLEWRRHGRPLPRGIAAAARHAGDDR